MKAAGIGWRKGFGVSREVSVHKGKEVLSLVKHSEGCHPPSLFLSLPLHRARPTLCCHRMHARAAEADEREVKSSFLRPSFIPGTCHESFDLHACPMDFSWHGRKDHKSGRCLPWERPQSRGRTARAREQQVDQHVHGGVSSRFVEGPPRRHGTLFFLSVFLTWEAFEHVM